MHGLWLLVLFVAVAAGVSARARFGHSVSEWVLIGPSRLELSVSALQPNGSACFGLVNLAESRSSSRVRTIATPFCLADQWYSLEAKENLILDLDPFTARLWCLPVRLRRLDASECGMHVQSAPPLTVYLYPVECDETRVWCEPRQLQIWVN